MALCMVATGQGCLRATVVHCVGVLFVLSAVAIELVGSAVCFDVQYVQTVKCNGIHETSSAG